MVSSFKNRLIKLVGIMYGYGRGQDHQGVVSHFVAYVLGYPLATFILSPDTNIYSWHFFSQALIAGALYSLVLSYRKAGIAFIILIWTVHLGVIGYRRW